jgi:hypothetical protein
MIQIPNILIVILVSFDAQAGRTALMIARLHGHSAIVDFLMAK